MINKIKRESIPIIFKENPVGFHRALGLNLSGAVRDLSKVDNKSVLDEACLKTLIKVRDLLFEVAAKGDATVDLYKLTSIEGGIKDESFEVKIIKPDNNDDGGNRRA